MNGPAMGARQIGRVKKTISKPGRRVRPAALPHQDRGDGEHHRVPDHADGQRCEHGPEARQAEELRHGRARQPASCGRSSRSVVIARPVGKTAVALWTIANQSRPGTRTVTTGQSDPAGVHEKK